MELLSQTPSVRGTFVSNCSYSYKGNYPKSFIPLGTETPPTLAARVARVVTSDFEEFLLPTHYTVGSNLGR